MTLREGSIDVTAWPTPATREALQPSSELRAVTDDFADEVAPKQTEFCTEADAKAMTDAPFQRIP
jgi:hypothetical protein